MFDPEYYDRHGNARQVRNIGRPAVGEQVQKPEDPKEGSHLYDMAHDPGYAEHVRQLTDAANQRAGWFGAVPTNRTPHPDQYYSDN